MLFHSEAYIDGIKAMSDTGGGDAGAGGQAGGRGQRHAGAKRAGRGADEFRPIYRVGKEDRRGTAKPVQNQGAPSIPLDVGHHP